MFLKKKIFAYSVFAVQNCYWNIVRFFSEIATYEIERGDVLINHLNSKREIQVSADLKSPDESASDILEDVKGTIMPEISSKYPTVSAVYEGQNREAEKTKSSAMNVGFTIHFVIILIKKCL